jgi:hypothetical protein
MINREERVRPAINYESLHIWEDYTSIFGVGYYGKIKSNLQNKKSPMGDFLFNAFGVALKFMCLARRGARLWTGRFGFR